MNSLLDCFTASAGPLCPRDPFQLQDWSPHFGLNFRVTLSTSALASLCCHCGWELFAARRLETGYKVAAIKHPPSCIFQSQIQTSSKYLYGVISNTGEERLHGHLTIKRLQPG